MTGIRNGAFATGVSPSPFVVARYGLSVPVVAGLIVLLLPVCRLIKLSGLVLQRKSPLGGDNPDSTVYTFAGFGGLWLTDFPGLNSRVEQRSAN